MVYLNAGFFTPFCILISIIFLPLSIACLVLTIVDFRLESFIITLVFWLIYFIALLVGNKFSTSKKYFLHTDESDCIVINYPNASQDNNSLRLDKRKVIKMEYYKLSSFRAWCMLYNCVCPQCLYITYLCNGMEEKSFIGYPNFDKIKNFCVLSNIELIIK